MSRRYYHLPPLTTLAAFETAARHLSFKEAAQELSVTPGAVSHQIKALEGELGLPLFRRKHRGVELTVEGESLYEALAGSFAKLSQCLKSLRERNSGNRVTVGSTSAVAALWLSPALVRFWRSHPDVDVNQSIQDEQSLNMPEIDLYIRYGRGMDTQLMQTELFRDRLGPVSSPELAWKLQTCELAELAQQRLIHLETGNRNWTTWHDWFHLMGYDGPVSPGIRVNNYAVALQVAQDGAGLALGWLHLIRPLLNTGQLAAVGRYTLPAPNRFYLVGRPDEQLTEAACSLKKWIMAELENYTGEVT